MSCSIRKASQAVLLILVSAASVALGQVSTGTIAGTVTDIKGAVTTGATVQAKNTDTGIVTEATTSSSGFYSLPNLQPGPYSVTVTAPGFSEQVANDIQLRVGA